MVPCGARVPQLNLHGTGKAKQPMARKSKLLRTSRWVYPDGYDEKEPDPFRIQFIPLTGAEVRTLEREAWERAQRTTKNGKQSTLQENLIETIQERTDDIVRTKVTAVEGYGLDFSEATELAKQENLTLDDDGMFWPTNGEDLVKVCPLGDLSDVQLLDEIATMIRDGSTISEGQLKK